VACRVFIADDVEALRVLWREFLEEDDDIEVVGEAGDGVAALDGVRETRPDVLLLDLSMPRLDGLEVIRSLRAERVDTRVVVASGFAASRLASVALREGAVAYFEKGGSVDDLRGTVLDACEASLHFTDLAPSTDG